MESAGAQQSEKWIQMCRGKAEEGGGVKVMEERKEVKSGRDDM